MKILWIALWIQAQLVIFASGNDGLLEEGNVLPEILSTIDIPIEVCPGADLTKVTPGTENCEVPICDATLATTKFKSPAASPSQYYDCLSATIVRKNNCPPGQCFNYKTQICVNPSEWENPCYYQLAPKKPLQTCPGVDIEALTPGDQNCDVQECSQQLYSAKAILPMADPTKYYDCLTAKIMRISSCAPGRCFNFILKKCVEPKDWVNACYFIPPTTTTSTSTTSTTTSTTTTPTTSTSSSTSTTTTTTTTTEPTTTTPPTTLPTVCPGSDPSQLTPGTQSCIEPTCTQELYNSKVKMTHANPQKYYDCISAAYLRTMNCVSGRCFDYSSQSCVEPVDWHNSCIY